MKKDNNNKYLSQANFFTRSVFKLQKEIHKDIVYLIQSKVDFFGDAKDVVHLSFNDYTEYKKIKKKDTYSFEGFYTFLGEVKAVGGFL